MLLCWTRKRFDRFEMCHFFRSSAFLTLCLVSVCLVGCKGLEPGPPSMTFSTLDLSEIESVHYDIKIDGNPLLEHNLASQVTIASRHVIVFEPSCPFCQVKCSSKPSVPVFLPCQQIKISCSSSRNCYQILTTAFFKFVCNLCGRALKAGSLSGPGAGGAGVVTVNLGLK